MATLPPDEDETPDDDEMPDDVPDDVPDDEVPPVADEPPAEPTEPTEMCGIDGVK